MDPNACEMWWETTASLVGTLLTYLMFVITFSEKHGILSMIMCPMYSHVRFHIVALRDSGFGSRR